MVGHGQVSMIPSPSIIILPAQSSWFSPLSTIKRDYLIISLVYDFSSFHRSYFLFNFIGVSLIYNVILVSGVQRAC